MTFVVAEVRGRAGDWRIHLSHEMGSAGGGETRRAALVYFRDRIAPIQSCPVFLLIYTDLDHLDETWLFRPGHKPRKLPVASWLHEKKSTGDGGRVGNL